MLNKKIQIQSVAITNNTDLKNINFGLNKTFLPHIAYNNNNGA